MVGALALSGWNILIVVLVILAILYLIRHL